MSLSSHNRYLNTMDVDIVMRKMNITDDIIKNIGDNLDDKDCVTIKIDISHNSKVTDVGIHYLARGLRFNTSVHSIVLDGLNITDRGLHVMAKALEDNTTLTSISIKSCPNLTVSGITSFMKSIELHNGTLKKLIRGEHLKGGANSLVSLTDRGQRWIIPPKK